MRSLGSPVLTGGRSWTEGRQAKERLRAVGPLGPMFSLEVKFGISPIQRLVRVLQHICTLNGQVMFFLVVTKEDFIFSTTCANIEDYKTWSGT